MDYEKCINVAPYNSYDILSESLQITKFNSKPQIVIFQCGIPRTKITKTISSTIPNYLNLYGLSGFLEFGEKFAFLLLSHFLNYF